MCKITDFHSHILPGIDDGSASVEQSIEMLSRMAQQGISQVVATPHFYPNYDDPERFLRRRADSYKALSQAMEAHPGLPQVILGAEVLFFSGMSESELLPQLTIEKKRCILIEMPPPPWTDAMYRELEAVRTQQRLVPVVAHVDRYIKPLRTHRIPQRLAQLPVLVQANASFFLKPATASMAMKLLKADQIQLLGSDCHNLTTRPPEMGRAVERIADKLGQGILDRIRNYEHMILDV
jgi:protein-tyrosine phosphatase